MNMSWIKSERTKEILIIAAMSIGLLLLIDGFLGYSILKHVPIDSRNSVNEESESSIPFTTIHLLRVMTGMHGANRNIDFARTLTV